MPEPPSPHAAGAVPLPHGGRAGSPAPPATPGPPGLRTRAFARVRGEDPHHARVLIGYVRHRMRGWNAERAGPVHDTRRPGRTCGQGRSSARRAARASMAGGTVDRYGRLTQDGQERCRRTGGAAAGPHKVTPVRASAERGAGPVPA
ncbi:hypothetical protein GCM10010327_64870 [Streptomyces nitrosporeus]|nr:hypothetical protein GCM10010327_64870 [Streptomyces nitrosporeus]